MDEEKEDNVANPLLKLSHLELMRAVNEKLELHNSLHRK